jgi:hypothetical protein
LARVGQPIPEFQVDLWLLTHPDLQNVARVNAFMNFVAEAISVRRSLLAG